LRNQPPRPENPMTEVLARDWKALLLCFLLAVLVWFLVNEGGVQPVSTSLPGPADGLAPSLDAP
jgi:hypothetical protein